MFEKKRRLASGERKDEQRNKSQRQPPGGPDEGNSPGTTARVEHKELYIALGKLTPTSQEKKKEPNKCKRKPANERKHKISNFIHTRTTYIAQELGDSRMVRYCMYTVLNRQNIGPCLSNPNAVSACARSQAIMYCEMHLLHLQT